METSQLHSDPATLNHHWATCLVKARKSARVCHQFASNATVRYFALPHLSFVLLGIISSHVFNGLDEARARHGDCSRCAQCSCCYLLLYSDMGMVSQGGKDCHRLRDADQISVVHMWQCGECFLCCDFGCLHLVAHLLQGMSIHVQTYPFVHSLYSKVFTSEN